LARHLVIRQLHDGIKAGRLGVPADVENGDKPLMRARNWLELLNAGELALERTFISETLAADDLMAR